MSRDQAQQEPIISCLGAIGRTWRSRSIIFARSVRLAIIRVIERKEPVHGIGNSGLRLPDADRMVHRSIRRTHGTGKARTSALRNRPFVDALRNRPFVDALRNRPFVDALRNWPFVDALRNRPFVAGVNLNMSHSIGETRRMDLCVCAVE